jgi:hypothetical protein
LSGGGAPRCVPRGTCRTLVGMRMEALLAAALLAVSLNAAAGDRPTGPGPYFYVTEFSRDRSSIVAENHYHPLPGSPTLVPVGRWTCSAFAPAATSPNTGAQWDCGPTKGDPTMRATISCDFGESASMTLSEGTPPKVYGISILWPNPAVAH